MENIPYEWAMVLKILAIILGMFIGIGLFIMSLNVREKIMDWNFARKYKKK